MEYFLIACVVVVGGFGIALLISTLCMGKNIFITLQVLMGSLSYSKEVDDKLNIALGKVDAGLYHVFLDEYCILLYDKEKYPDVNLIQPVYSKPDYEIWIENKFYSYGKIFRIGGDSPPRKYREKRPSLKTIKQIMELERSNGKSTTKVKKDKTKEPKTVVLE